MLTVKQALLWMTFYLSLQASVVSKKIFLVELHGSSLTRDWDVCLKMWVQPEKMQFVFYSKMKNSLPSWTGSCHFIRHRVIATKSGSRMVSIPQHYIWYCHPEMGNVTICILERGRDGYHSPHHTSIGALPGHVAVSSRNSAEGHLWPHGEFLNSWTFKKWNYTVPLRFSVPNIRRFSLQKKHISDHNSFRFGWSGNLTLSPEQMQSHLTSSKHLTAFLTFD